MLADQAVLMHPGPFNHLKAQVATASATQILELEDVIHRVVAQQFVEMALARRTRSTIRNRTCPHCKSNNVVRHGKDQNQRQRFKCRGCSRTYNILTGTSMARARKPEKWESYLGFMTEHKTVRAIRKAGIGLNHVTIWRWRHRFLTAAAHANAAMLYGVIEVEATFFRRSFKGSRGWQAGTPPVRRAACSRGRGAVRREQVNDLVPVLSALDSSGGVFQAILESLTDIETVLPGRIAAGSVLCAADHVGYARVADQANAEFCRIHASTATPEAIKGKLAAMPRRVTGRLSLRRVHTHHQQLKHLINERCCGVATKYLAHYLGWHRAMVRPGFEGKALLTQALASPLGEAA